VSSPPGPDSFAAGLARAAGSRKGRTYMQVALPWIGAALLSAFTGVLGWVGGKVDTKTEMQAVLAARADMAAAKQLAQTQHAEVLAALEKLRGEVLSDSLRTPGRVTRLERAQYAVWHELAEHRAMVLTAETAKSRAVKEAQGARFGRSFDNRTRNGEDPAIAHEQLYAQVAIPP
jgi:hypothetical protein